MSELRGLILAMGLDSEDDIPAKQMVIDAIKTFDVKKTGKVSREDFVKGMDHMIRKLKGDFRRSHTSAEIPDATLQEPTIGQLITGTKVCSWCSHAKSLVDSETLQPPVKKYVCTFILAAHLCR